MSRFLTPLDTRLVDEFDDIHELLHDFLYESDLLGTTVCVPKGFLTDFASVPRLPLAYLLFGGKGKKAAVIHDWFYSNHFVEREVADALLYEAMVASGYSHFVAGTFEQACRIGGESRWNAPNLPQSPEIAGILGDLKVAAGRG